MKKEMIFGLFGIALVAFVGFGLYRASKFQSIQIVKSVIVNGTREEVFNMVRYLKNFPKWSPFLAQDPTQQYKVKGIDGAIGAQYHWEGNKGKDLGYQEIIKMDQYKLIGIKCNIQKPFVAAPTFEYSFEETTSGIVVTQNFKLQSGIMNAFFMWVFGAKTGIEKTNQQGLDLLKKAIENKI